MRVALFTDTFEPQVNGVANTLRHLLETFDQRGVEYLVFAPGDDPGWKDNICRIPGSRVPFYPELIFSWPVYAKIWRALDTFHPNVLHIVTESSIGWCGRAYGVTRKTPIVSSFHTNFPQYLSKYNLSFLEEFCWRYLRGFHGVAARTLCPSQATLASLRTRGFKNLDIWGRGVDPMPAVTPEECREFRARYALGEGPLLLYVGRLSQEKDLDVLLDAVKLLDDDDYAGLLVVGDGPQRRELEAVASDKVVFTGHLRGQALASAYATADVFAFPSTSETYGNVVLEAMSAGLPVVAPLAGGITENLRPGHNGLSCRSRDSEDMASALRQILRDESLRQRLGENARATAACRNWLTTNDAVIDAYRQTLLMTVRPDERVAGIRRRQPVAVTPQGR